MNKKIKLLIEKKWKTYFLWWCIFPFSSFFYITLFHYEIISKNSPVNPYIEMFYTKIALNVDSANAYFVMIPVVFLLCWILSYFYKLERQHKTYLRKVFEFLLNPIVNVLNSASGLFVSMIFLDKYSDLISIQSYFSAMLLACISLIVTISLKLVGREIFNMAIVKNNT